MGNVCLFGEKISPEQFKLMSDLAGEVVLDLREAHPRAGSRRRLMAKSLLRELLLERGINPSLFFIDLVVESAIRHYQLPFR